MSKIYVSSSGGMGNFLFQISAGIYYKEKYPDIYDEIILIEGQNSSFDWGTSIGHKKSTRKTKTGENLSYRYTILNKFKFGEIDKANIFEIKNDYTCNHHNPNSDQNLYITGYNQNSLLFIEHLNKIPQYLNLEDEEIKSYLRDKYPLIFFPERKNIMVGIRCDGDFTHMTKVCAESYKRGLEFFKEDHNTNIVVITDRVDKINDYLIDNYSGTIIVIDEDDIVQLYAGLVCDYFILSESTYHYWIAALKNAISPEKTNVVCFADTDITNRNLALPEWSVL